MSPPGADSADSGGDPLREAARLVRRGLAGDPAALEAAIDTLRAIPLPDRGDALLAVALTVRGLIEPRPADLDEARSRLRPLVDRWAAEGADPPADQAELLARCRTWLGLLDLVDSLGSAEPMAAAVRGLMAQGRLDLPADAADPGLPSPPEETARREAAAAEPGPPDLGPDGLGELSRLLSAAQADDGGALLDALERVETLARRSPGLVPEALWATIAPHRAMVALQTPTAVRHRAAAVQALRDALAGVGAGDPLRPDLLIALGRAGMLDLIATRDPAHAGPARAAFAEAVELLGPDDARRVDALSGAGHVELLADLARDPSADLEAAGTSFAAALAGDTEPGTEGDRALALSGQLFGAAWQALSGGGSDAVDPLVRSATVELSRAPAGSPAAEILATTLKFGLMIRGDLNGDQLDVDAAGLLSLPSGQDVLIPGIGSAADLQALTGAAARLKVLMGGDGTPAELAALAAELSALAERMPDDSPFLSLAASSLGLTQIVLGARTGQWPRIRAGLATTRAAADTADPRFPLSPVLLATAAAAAAAVGLGSAGAESDDWLDDGIELARRAHQLERPSDSRVRLGAMLGRLLWERHAARCGRTTSAAPDGGPVGELDEAAELLETAWTWLTSVPGRPNAADVGTVLAQVLRARGRHVPEQAGPLLLRARTVGQQALARYGREVLLQTGTGRALRAAQDVGEVSQRLARWCLADGDPAGAVVALETGRGLVLAAATAGDAVGRLLAATADTDLLDRWARARAGADHGPGPGTGPLGALTGLEVHPDELNLRHQVLAAVDRVAPVGWWNPDTSVEQVAAAVRAAGAEALVYLLPAGDGAVPAAEPAGDLVVVRPDGTVGRLPGPELTVQPGSWVARLAAASAQGTPPDELLVEAGRRAWSAVGPLLDALPPEPDVVLVPVGALAVVPWHAADAGAGRRPRACQRAVIRYASSARELAEACARPVIPPAAGAVLVANTTGDLPAAARAAAWARDQLGDGARLVGAPPELTDGPATGRHVLEALTGADVPPVALLALHCHAGSSADPAVAGVELGSETLTLSRILDRAGRGGGAAGGVVLLSACSSALSVADHDEALTLASGFLAAGARSVIGTRWPVGDLITAAFSVVLHQRLLEHPHHPARALALAQRWLLDPERAPLADPPPWFPQATLRAAGPGSVPLAACWAAFAHHGA